MPVLEREGRKAWQRMDRRAALLSWLGWLGGVLLVLACWRFIAGQTTWPFVWDAPRQTSDLFSRMWPPEWETLPGLWRPLWDTVNIATLGTLLGIVVAVPCAFLAARNTTPHSLVRTGALLVVVSSRSINALIWALLFVAILGPGTLAGILAIGLRSVGFIGKLLYEAIEEVDARPVEAVRSTGASSGRCWCTPLCRRCCPRSRESARTVGTLTFGSPWCWGWWVRAASGCCWTTPLMNSSGRGPA